MQKMQESPARSLGWEDALEEEWQPTQVFLPEKFLSQRSLVGYSPKGHKELGTIEQLSTTLNRSIPNSSPKDLLYNTGNSEQHSAVT